MTHGSYAVPVRIVMRRVLWTLVPIGSLGLLGWVPPLRIALRRKTPAAWLWLAGSAAGAALVIVLTSTVRQPGLKDTPPTWVGAIELVNIISTAVYTGMAGKVLTPKPGPTRLPPLTRDAYGYGRYPGQPAAYLSPPPIVAPPVVTPPVVVPPVVPSNAVDAAAAEVQAELRELRDFLGESAGGRQREEQDRRGEW